MKELIKKLIQLSKILIERFKGYHVIYDVYSLSFEGPPKSKNYTPILGFPEPPVLEITFYKNSNNKLFKKLEKSLIGEFSDYKIKVSYNNEYIDYILRALNLSYEIIPDIEGDHKIKLILRVSGEIKSEKTIRNDENNNIGSLSVYIK